jgi:hypothetical protein
MTSNHSSTRIPVVDYTGFTTDVVSIVWLQSPHISYGSLHLTTRNLTDVKSHTLSFNISDLAVDRSSCERDLILVVQDQSEIYQLNVNSMNLKILTKDAHEVSGLFVASGLMYWIQERQCLFRQEILSNRRDKQKITCLPDASLSAVFVPHAGHDGHKPDAWFMLSSYGDVYRMQDEDQTVIKIVTAEEYKDRKILKYEKNDFDSLHVNVTPGSPNEMQVFVGIKNHGILLEILVHCSDLTDGNSCQMLSIRDEINENRLYDFKLLSDPGINCTDHENTIRSQVLVDHKQEQDGKRLLRSSPFLFTRDMSPTTWIIISALISCALLLLVTKMMVGIYRGRRHPAPTLLGDLLRSQRQHRDCNAILRRSASINSVAQSQNPLKFPPKSVLSTPVRTVSSPAPAPGLPHAISIEDLTGFQNPSFTEALADGGRSRTVSQRSCGTCDYKDECRDMGICLSTYRLLHH